MKTLKFRIIIFVSVIGAFIFSGITSNAFSDTLTPQEISQDTTSSGGYSASQLEQRTADAENQVALMEAVTTPASVIEHSQGALNAAAQQIAMGDLNMDGAVDLQDLGIFRANYNMQDPQASDGDMNGDGKIDLQDFGILKGHYGWSNVITYDATGGVVSITISDVNGVIQSGEAYYEDGRLESISRYEAGQFYVADHYYDDQDNRLMATIWANGQYTHYTNETVRNWSGHDVGRMDVFFNPSDPINGVTAYKYEYFENTGTISEILFYATADISDIANPVFNNLLGGESYYQDGKKESKYTTAPDNTGNIYYHYMDDQANLADIEISQSADADGVIARRYTYYSPTMISTIDYYRYADYSDSSAPVLTMRTKTETYDNILYPVMPPATAYYYQDSANRKAASTSYNSYSGWSYTHYLNENFNGQGYGRIDIHYVEGYTQGDGVYAYRYEYYDNTNNIYQVYGYRTVDFTDIFNPALMDLIYVRTYDPDGNIV